MSGQLFLQGRGGFVEMEAGRGDEPTIYNGEGGAGTRTLQSIKGGCLADSSSRWKGSY